jgi:hypothetical protein
MGPKTLFKLPYSCSPIAFDDDDDDDDDKLHMKSYIQ